MLAREPQKCKSEGYAILTRLMKGAKGLKTDSEKTEETSMTQGKQILNKAKTKIRKEKILLVDFTL